MPPLHVDRNYESEASLFLKDLKKQNPELEAQQLAGRALLWDRQIDSQAQIEQAEAKIRQKAYPYQTEPNA